MSAAPPNDRTVQPKPSRARRILRVLFRCFRTVLLLVVFVVVILGLFLNKVGLPEFFKKRVVEQLRAKGWDVEFSRLRLHWYRGIVAQDLNLRRTNKFFGPQLFVDRAECRLNHTAFKSFDLQVDSLVLKGGRLVWPLAATNQSIHFLDLNSIEGELRVQANDQWELRNFRARFEGVQLQLTGTMVHASQIRDWKFPKGATKPAGSTEALWHRIVSTARQMQFAGAPELVCTFQGDAGDFKRLDADLKFRAQRLKSPWGAGQNVSLSAHLFPPRDSNDIVQAEFLLAADEADTPWGQAKTVRLNAGIEPSYSRLISTNAHLALEVRAAETRWGQAARLLATATLTPCFTNGVSVQTELIATADDAQTRWGNAWRAELTAHSLLPPQDQWHLFQTNLDWPNRLDTLPFDATVTLSNVHSPKIELEKISLTAQWRPPELKLETAGILYDGELTANAELNAITRELSFTGSGSFDAQRISPLLTTNGQRWLANYSWRAPPKLQTEGRLLLPAWTNQHPNWGGEVLPTISLQGRFEVGEGAYRGIGFTSAESPFSLTNLIWRLPRLKVTRPEGSLQADYTSNPQTRDFHWRVTSQIDPRVAKPLFEKETQQRAFDFFEFTTPPFVQAEIWGRWHDVERLGVVATVVASNLTFRGEAVRHVQTRLQYTNRVLTFLEPKIERTEGTGSAPGVTIDFVAQKLFLTNAFGNLNPYAVTRAIGKQAARAIEPYQFDSPPTVRVNGVVDLKRKRYEEDLHFEVRGGPFRWSRIRLQELTGNVDWVGEAVSLTNVGGAFRTGRVGGEARFDFGMAQEGADFSFKVVVAEADLHELMEEISAKTNKLEGIFSGELVITNANTSQRPSWQGYGRVDLRDGLLWEIPVFGIFSPVLNTFIPGLGNLRAREAAAAFIVTNSVFYSGDLEIHATAMRMQFQGWVDFERRVDARVEAELLRDIPGIGVVISKILWPVTKLFEYKVSGTLSQPKAEPLYVVPKILLMPLHPLKTLKDLFGEEQKAPPEK